MAAALDRNHCTATPGFPVWFGLVGGVGAVWCGGAGWFGLVGLVRCVGSRRSEDGEPEARRDDRRRHLPTTNSTSR